MQYVALLVTTIAGNFWCACHNLRSTSGARGINSAMVNIVQSIVCLSMRT